MKIGFYIDEMNVRGVANSTYLYALNNKLILKNQSIIFYNKKNFRNKIEVIQKFKKKFKSIGISNFKEIDEYKEKCKNNSTKKMKKIGHVFDKICIFTPFTAS